MPFSLQSNTTFQSTPSVGRATCFAVCASRRSCSFQSTPSVGRATVRNFIDRFPCTLFQSTPSVGRATRCCRKLGRNFLYFNPRPPWGGRLLSASAPTSTTIFQSTPSVGRATKVYELLQSGLIISIHALRGEGDLNIVDEVRIKQVKFQSTPSVGRATTF